ncbi:MAG: glycosyltransferase [Gammaproteobacteria bacterium]|nr:glycosyltransferase [Gammaproteobacteria bacterium]MBU2058447.1 glycosyltransferase [Gammaproteobacteria bacterium]MBU2176500.1 glycosyltransferase [Gammaproteobacteria bacterium]MBU2248558.1 glycosyltransferase [Gammaproteobacteria bacterium]MBU2345579.1 glycosyltransferase [Gammaproteobacteria bacterium]
MLPKKLNVLMIAHYYPPINSSGAKRFQYLSQYFAEDGVEVSVFTTQKTSEDGEFSERIPVGVNIFEFDSFGRLASSVDNGKQFVPLYSDKPSFKRRFKDFVMSLCGQLPDPRLPFALSFLLRTPTAQVRKAIESADVIIATSPPWSMLLAGLILKSRYKKKLVLDYRDHFSYCHEMPGNFIAKKLEYFVDRWLVSKADLVVTISEPMRKYYSKFDSDVHVVSNGYDFESMEKARLASAEIDSKRNTVNIRYMGIVSDGRIPRNFISALNKLSLHEPTKFEKIKIEFYGNAGLLRRFLAENYPNLLKIFHFSDFVSYHESLKLMIESDYLLFSETSNIKDISAQGILTTKVFEYVGSGRPILADISIDTLPGKLVSSCSDRNLVSLSTDDFYNKISSAEFYEVQSAEVSEMAMLYTRKNQSVLYKKILEELLGHDK